MKNSPDEKKSPEEKRKERIDHLLYMIGGLEESLRMSMEQKDWDFVKVLRPLKTDYYERLRRVAYGLPEERKLPAEKKG